MKSRMQNDTLGASWEIKGLTIGSYATVYNNNNFQCEHVLNSWCITLILLIVVFVSEIVH